MGKQEINLNGAWRMRMAGSDWMPATVPGSLYSTLLANSKIQDPYFGENQYDVCKLSDNDSDFEREFKVPQELLEHEHIILHFDGLDTLADITLNGTFLGHADNMHRIWEYEVSGLLQREGNLLSVHFASPTRYIAGRQKERPLWGVATTIPGYNYIRKAHYMFGWDWGPQLPDMGIWRGVSLLGTDTARLDGVTVAQEHKPAQVELLFRAEAERYSEHAELTAWFTLTAPSGDSWTLCAPLVENAGEAKLLLDHPALWWPNGYGEQPLYTLETILCSGGRELDRRTQRLGLRTVTISQEADQWGQEFCFLVNGVKIFGMGADYIPEDQIIARCSPEKTRLLLKQCADTNFNHLRVWGGGYYPEDWFFDFCDEMGLLVWQDFMFACAVYRMSNDFTENIRREMIDNIKRIRHHACLALWCGNNEMETAWDSWGIPQEDDLREDYLFQFEKMIPSLCSEFDPATFYWPSSPSCGGRFDEPNSFDRGDVHYWDVWHHFKPFQDFRLYYFRFCSEYGFMSLPNLKTIRSFAQPEDENLFSPVMEAHEKCEDGMKKLLYYMSQIVRYPSSFVGVIYATQLMQADAIRSNVEHMRRNRGRCMGSTYWQINDTNPVISWSSIDYAGRWKALQYYARRFYAPLLLSVDETNPAAVVLNISNETFAPVHGTIRWILRDNRSLLLLSGQTDVCVDGLSSCDCLSLDLSSWVSSREEMRSRYIEYMLLDENGETVSGGNTLFVIPKQFQFVNPALGATLAETDDAFVLTITAAAFAKGVCLDLLNTDCCFSDNWFDIQGGESVRITILKSSLSARLNAAEFMQQLTLQSNYDCR